MNPRKPKITPHNLELFTEPVTDIYRALEDEVFEMVAKRLKTSKDITKDNVFQWQVDKLNQLRLVNSDTVKALSKTTGIAEKEIRKAIMGTGIETIRSVDYELAAVYNKLPIPTHIDRILETFVNQTFREFNNYVNQTLITTNYGQGLVTDMYRKIVEETTGRVLAGTTTINKAIAETTIRWANRGIDTAFVDRGGHVWNLERYSETVIRSTVNRTYNELRMSRMAEYGVELVLVSTLPDPREICSLIQGKVASMKPMDENDTEYPSIFEYGYGEPGGCRGINCRHQFFPFVEGLNENNQREYSEEEMTKGRELRQKQRYYERQVRKGKRALKVAEEVGDTDVIAHQKKILRNRQKASREFVRESDLTRRYDKERIIV